jgi:hypothetical protein
MVFNNCPIWAQLYRVPHRYWQSQHHTQDRYRLTPTCINCSFSGCLTLQAQHPHQLMWGVQSQGNLEGVVGVANTVVMLGWGHVMQGHSLVVVVNAITVLDLRGWGHMT